MTSQYTLILLRHGNSLWNQQNLFTGWVDVDLSDQGRQEAKRAGELLAESGLKPDLLYTSLLRRAISTANIALDTAERSWIEVKRSWRLNERHYGALLKPWLNMGRSSFRFGAEALMFHHRQLTIRISTPKLETSATPTLVLQFQKLSA